MHPYQTDGEIRTRILIGCAFLAIGSARVLSLVIQHLPFAIPWWIETPSVLGFFWLFVWLFDNYFWKLKLVQHLAWFYIPNLNGKWEAEISSSHEGFNKPLQADVVIRQTASKISICLETAESYSYSVNATLMRADKQDPFELDYTYINHPKADAKTTMSIHRGTAWHKVSDDGRVLDGEYYNGRGRQNFGTLLLKRI